MLFRKIKSKKMKTLSHTFFKIIFSYLVILSFIFSSCDEQNDGLAPYIGSPQMSGITIQENTYKPKITWLGGYVSVFGVNYGSKASLDSTLVFLVYKAGNDLRYPLTIGEIPPGAQDLASQYGGSMVDSLTEDSTYTFWVLKEAEWTQVSSMNNKILIYDSTLTGSIQFEGDTIKLSGKAHTQLSMPLDIYINISITLSANNPGGRLILNGGTITVDATNNSNNPVINWIITQVEDSSIAAMGIVEGGQFNPNSEIWSVYSVSDSAGQTQYGKTNVISPPVTAGQNFQNTQAFVEYPADGLKKNTTYYLWIANKLWDGEGRLRTTNYYAYVTFNTH
jgi:hypothetical protein